MPFLRLRSTKNRRCCGKLLLIGVSGLSDLVETRIAIEPRVIEVPADSGVASL